MRQRLTETSILVVSVLKWFAIASVVGVLVGGSTALFLWCLQWATGVLGTIPYHYALLPVALFLSALIV
jgi:H+/Cl- antiporter ClcA